jgi:hypothetical protein
MNRTNKNLGVVMYAADLTEEYVDYGQSQSS